MIIAAVCFLIICVLLYFYWLNRRGNPHVARIAKELGLNFTPARLRTMPSLRGTCLGIPVHVYAEVLGGINSQANYTIYTASLNPDHVPAGLIVSKERTLSKVGQVLGPKDIQIGDKQFDRTFKIEATDEHQTREFFQRPHVKEHFLALLKQSNSFRLEENVLRIEIKRYFMREHRFMGLRIKLLVSCAQAISATAAPSAQLPFPKQTLPEQFNLTNSADAW